MRHHLENGAPRRGKTNQFALPHGFSGRVVGIIMAFGNADMERKAVKSLGLSGNESVLEIGFGPGVGIRQLTRRLTQGSVAGIEPSDVMIEQATRRNSRTIRDGSVDLRRGTASSLPWEAGRFDAVVSVNNVQEWPSIQGDLQEVRRVLKPGGRLVIAVHAWVDKYAKDRGVPEQPWESHIAYALDAAGFSDVHFTKSRAISGRALYFTARKVLSDSP